MTGVVALVDTFDSTLRDALERIGDPGLCCGFEREIIVVDPFAQIQAG